MLMALGFAFQEVMEGTVEHVGERFDRPFRFDVAVSTPRVLARVALCDADGTLTIDGLAKNVRAIGHLELSPLVERRIRYVLDFTGDDGVRYRFDGEKKIAHTFAPLPKLLKSWTTLPGEVRTASGELWGRALLRFHLIRDLRALASSVRVGRHLALGASHA
jgi:hypothetical protein